MLYIRPIIKYFLIIKVKDQNMTRLIAYNSYFVSENLESKFPARYLSGYENSAPVSGNCLQPLQLPIQSL